MIKLLTRIDTSIALALMLFVMVAYSMWQVNLKRDKNRYLILATIGLFFELTLTVIYNVLLYLKATDLAILIIFSFMLLQGTLASEFIIFYVLNFFGIKNINKTKKMCIYLPFLVEAYMLVENTITGSSFRIVNGELSRGPIFLYHIIILIVHLIVCLTISVINRKNVNKTDFSIIISTGILLTVIFGLEAGNRDVTILWNNITFAIIVYYSLSQDRMVEYDILTKAMAPEYFYVFELKEIKKKNNKNIIAILDLDDIGSINKFIGLDEGDKVLRKVVDTLYRTLDINDKVIRISGDKFGIVFDTEDMDIATKNLNNFKEKIQKYNEKSNNKYNIEYSLAIDVFNLNEVHFVDAIGELTKQIYEIKKYKNDHYLKTFSQEI